MKLANVFMANAAFKKITAAKLSPKVAYQLLKYLKSVVAEYEIVERQRTQLVLDISGKKEGEEASILPGTPEYARFVTEFSDILEVDAELKPMDMKMDDLIAALGSDPANALSAEDLSNLEPFFGV